MADADLESRILTCLALFFALLSVGLIVFSWIRRRIDDAAERHKDDFVWRDWPRAGANERKEDEGSDPPKVKAKR